MFTQICKKCGVEYEAIYPNSRYCSARCRLDAENDYWRGYREKNREKLRKYNREYQRRYGKG